MRQSVKHDTATNYLEEAQGGVHPRVLPSVVHLPEVWKGLLQGFLQAEVFLDSVHLESAAAVGCAAPPAVAPVIQTS